LFTSYGHCSHYRSSGALPQYRVIYIQVCGRCNKMPTLCLGLLSVLVLVVILPLSVENLRWQTSLSSLATEREQLQITSKNLTIEKDQLKNRLSEMEKLLREGWTYFQSHFYYISTEMKPWAKSREDCKSRGAELVIINSKDEQEFLSRLGREVWIGLTDSDGSWKWVDSTKLTTGYWDKGQPNSYGGNEDCAEIRPGQNLQNWNDDLCTRNQMWLCEKMLV
uniref:C-type lectin domain-containing protein n=1 Tax=Denticeps clupeoides TaxID=299321 RepID=A0AAY4EQ77_9TELE